MSSITQRPKEDQNVWNFVLVIFFLAVFVGVLYYMWYAYGTFPQSVSVFDMVLMALATFRVTRLVVYDKIMRWFRELFVKKQVFERDGQMWVELTPYKNGFLNTVYDLLGCPWCISFWSALIIGFCYYIFPWAWFVIFFLALAGLGSFIQILANVLGWRAENLKQDSHEKEERSHHMVDRTSVGK